MSLRFFGLGGIFHSDEFLITVSMLKMYPTFHQHLNGTPKMHFILIGGPSEVLPLAVREVYDRLIKAFSGVVPETRSVANDGSTVFIRPRPGSAELP